MNNIAKVSGLIICLCWVSTVAMANKGPVVKKSGNITTIDLGIYQPNVEDCNEMSVHNSDKEHDWIHIFPNPNPGLFTLELKLQQKGNTFKIQMYDISGALVLQTHETLDGNQFQKDTDVSYLRRGVYFIRITGKDGVGVKQIIIN